MRLQDFKNLFFRRFKENIPKNEIQSFFNLLIEHQLGLSRIDVALAPDKTILASDLQFLEMALNQLEEHKPIQYIIGETLFYNLPFKVNSSVLIPRIETEELVTWALEKTKQLAPCNILDIGTGSGCIGVSFAKNHPEAKIYALDVSKEALKVAKSNALLNKVDLNFIHADILQDINLPEKMDVIISNPPYVRSIEKGQMDSNVLDFEPHLALFVEDDNPLLFYEHIAKLAKKYLKPKGLLFFEINQYLGPEIINLLESLDYKNIELKNDLFDKPRMVSATPG